MPWSPEAGRQCLHSHIPGRDEDSEQGAPRVWRCLWDPLLHWSGLGGVQAPGLEGSQWVPEHRLATLGLLVYFDRKPCQIMFSGVKRMSL